MSDKIFIPGMSVRKNENAPEWVLGNVSIDIPAFKKFLDEQTTDRLNVSLKRAKSGKCYAEVDTWKPAEKPARPEPVESDVPF